MKYKAGQMVILVSASNDVALPFIGLVRCLDRPSMVFKDCWILDPPLITTDGAPCSWAEEHMKPIRDSYGQDETLTWAGKPEKVTA